MKMRVMIVILLFILLVVLPVASLQWGPCPFQPSSAIQVGCVNASVPRNWNHPEDGDLYIFASRVEGTAPVKGSLFFLNGGSGVGGACGPGSQWISYIASLGFHVVLPDHRGTGLCSPRLDCPDDPYAVKPPSPACAKYFSDQFGATGMYNFSITQASFDLHYLMSQLGTPGANFVQGDSFGSFWEQRFLTIFPDDVKGAIIESFGTLGVWDYFKAPDNLDSVAKRLLSVCGADAVCNARLATDTDPFVFLALLNGGDSSECADKLAAAPMFNGAVTILAEEWKKYFRMIAANLVGSGTRETLALLPALLYRIARCDSDDQKVLKFLYVLFFANLRASSRDACTISQVVLYNLFFSECVPVPPHENIVAHWQALAVQVNISEMTSYLDLYKIWPQYPVDQYYKKFTNTTVPLLFLSGGLDANTPWDEATNAVFTYNAIQVGNSGISAPYYPRRLIRIPEAPHVAFLQSPVINSIIPCGLQLSVQFLHRYNTSLNTSCLLEIQPLDFQNGPSAVAEKYFNTKDLWNYKGPIIIVPLTKAPHTDAPIPKICEDIVGTTVATAVVGLIFGAIVARFTCRKVRVEYQALSPKQFQDHFSPLNSPRSSQRSPSRRYESPHVPTSNELNTNTRATGNNQASEENDFAPPIRRSNTPPHSPSPRHTSVSDEMSNKPPTE